MTLPLTAPDGSALASAFSPLAMPSSAYFENDDALRITSFNSAAAVTVVLEGRFQSVDGKVGPYRFTHVPNTDRSSASGTFPMGSGWLLNLQARVTGAAPRRGQCFVLVEIVRGGSSATESLGALMQGYVTATSRLVWPGSAVTDSACPPGVLRSILGTGPGAGLEITETVPSNARWRLLALFLTLVTDATVANRDAALTFDDGINTVARFPAAQNQLASLTTRYLWTSGGARVAIAQDRTIVTPIPDIWLPDAFRYKTVTTNIAAGDAWGGPRLLVEELIED